MTSRPMVLAALAGALAVALVVASLTAVVQSRRASEERDRADDLQVRVEALERQVAELEAAADAGDARGELGALDGLADLFGGLLDGESGDELSGLLDGLLDGSRGLRGDDTGGVFDELLSGATGDAAGLRCLTPQDGGTTLGGGAAGGDVPTDPDELVASITAQVERLRELELDREVRVEFLGDEELAADLERLLDEDLDPVAIQARSDILTALRAIPADADLEQLQRDLLEDQVAGYYSLEDERLVIRTPDDEVRPLDRITLAHEIGHALVDQAVGLPDLEDGIDADAALARLAVVEGDATLLMNRWTLAHLSLTEQLGLLGTSDLTGQQQQLEAFPHHLQRELVFPYTAGLDLVCDRWLAGGWAAVDATYADPPTTSAAVLFPERAGDAPADVPTLVAPAGGTARHEDTFGAAPLSWLFEAPGGETALALDDPVGRAGAWAGGEVRVWDVAGDPVVGLALAEREGAEPELCSSVTAWYAAAAPAATRTGSDGEVSFVGTDGTAVIRCDGSGVRLGVAADRSTAARVVGSS